jgi:NHL repeat-containing protein
MRRVVLVYKQNENNMKKLVFLPMFFISLFFTQCKKSGSSSNNTSPATGSVTTVLGNGSGNYSGDGGTSTSAQATDPNALGMDAAGNVYFSDLGSVREINVSTGIVSTVAGNQHTGYSGDGGQALAASLSGITSIVFDKAGDMILADYANNRIRMVNKATGIITTVAGGGTGILGDGGPATSATLIYPYGVCVDKNDNIYITDDGLRIRKVDATTGIITTFAGTGNAGFNGDGGPATSALINGASDLSFDTNGDLIFTDFQNSRVRKVSTSGVITTIGGNGSNAYNGDGGPATSAAFSQPINMTVDNNNNVYVADRAANVIRKIDASSGIISTLAGTGTAGFADGKISVASFSGPSGIRINSAGNIYVADRYNFRIRKITLN